MLKIAGLDLSINSSGVTVCNLDKEFNIIDVNSFGFTQVKKNERSNIIHFKNKDFSNEYEKYTFMINHIMEWTKDCEYVAVEDYAFGAQNSMIFNIAENSGLIKFHLLKAGAKLRLYTPKSVKKYFSAYGLSDKVGMFNAYNNYKGLKFDISDLPIVDNGRGVSPTSDIIDSFAICDMLSTELKIRNKKIELGELDKHIQECFTASSKTNKQGVLGIEFIINGTKCEC